MKYLNIYTKIQIRFLWMTPPIMVDMTIVIKKKTMYAISLISCYACGLLGVTNIVTNHDEN